VAPDFWKICGLLAHVCHPVSVFHIVEMYFGNVCCENVKTFKTAFPDWKNEFSRKQLFLCRTAEVIILICLCYGVTGAKCKPAEESVRSRHGTVTLRGVS